MAKTVTMDEMKSKAASIYNRLQVPIKTAKEDLEWLAANFIRHELDTGFFHGAPIISITKDSVQGKTVVLVDVGITDEAEKWFSPWCTGFGVIDVFRDHIIVLNKHLSVNAETIRTTFYVDTRKLTTLMEMQKPSMSALDDRKIYLKDEIQECKDRQKELQKMQTEIEEVRKQVQKGDYHELGNVLQV